MPALIVSAFISSISHPAPTLTNPGPSQFCSPLSTLDLETRTDLCELAPWGRAPACNFEPTVGRCLEIVGIIDACDLTTCDYVECAEALSEAACNVRPTACEAVSKCLSNITPENIWIGEDSQDIDPNDPFVYGCDYGETIAPDDHSPKSCAMMLASCIDATVGTCNADPAFCAAQQQSCWEHAQKCNANA